MESIKNKIDLKESTLIKIIDYNNEYPHFLTVFVKTKNGVEKEVEENYDLRFYYSDSLLREWFGKKDWDGFVNYVKNRSKNIKESVTKFHKCLNINRDVEK